MVINHGKKVLREIAGKTLWGKCKSFVSYWVAWAYWGGAVSVVLLAGVCSANALLGFN